MRCVHWALRTHCCLLGRLLSCTGGRCSGQLLIQTVSVCSVHCSDLGVNTAGSVGGGSLPAWLAGRGSGRGIPGESRVLPKCKQQVRLWEGRVQVGLAEEAAGHRAQSSVEEMPLPWLPVPDLLPAGPVSLCVSDAPCTLVFFPPTQHISLMGECAFVPLMSFPGAVPRRCVWTLKHRGQGCFWKVALFLAAYVSPRPGERTVHAQ